MAKATITLQSGTQVRIEGTPEEVAQVLERLEVPTARMSAKAASKGTSRRTSPQPRQRKAGPKAHIEELKKMSFFAERRTINDVQLELERNGHIYALTHLSTPLLRLVRNKDLRRLKQGDQWVYVNP